MTGRTVWVPKDAAWWRRARVVELGQAHGPAGPAVIDWLTCEAKTQNPMRGGDGRVKSGFAAVAHGIFSDADTVRAVVEMAVEVGLLDDFEDHGRTFTCRISGWHNDVEKPLAAARKAQQRTPGTVGDNGGQSGDNGGQADGLSPDVPGSHVTRQDKDKNNNNSVEPDRLDAESLDQARRRTKDERDLFDYWRRRCGHEQAKFTNDRRAKVRARLREGYSVADIRRAIDGAADGAFVNDNGKRYDDLELICRNGSKLESFIDRAGAVATVDEHPDVLLARMNARAARYLDDDDEVVA